jgi:F-box interacting protein
MYQRGINGEPPHDNQYGSYVFTLGSSEPPRHIGFLEKSKLAPLSVLFRGNLHWHPDESPNNNWIMVFDTTAESFRQMNAPPIRGYHSLFEMGGMLSMYSSSVAATVIDVWVMQDYEREVWAFKYRVELPFAEIRVQFPVMQDYVTVVHPSCDGDLLVLLKYGGWILHIDVHGKLVSSHRRGFGVARLGLKQTLVSHTFFPTLEGYVVNASLFI